MKGLSIFMVIFILFACNNDSDFVCATPEPIPICGNVLSVTEPDIFKAKCAVCHMLDKNITGPRLQNILDRLPNEEWFDNFIRNEDSLVAIGDTHAVEIQNWSPADGQHNFKEITDNQLGEIKKYLGQK
jgi:hypothetical protein